MSSQGKEGTGVINNINREVCVPATGRCLVRWLLGTAAGEQQSHLYLYQLHLSSTVTS